MNRYLLDTNIISDLVRPTPSAALLSWMRTKADEDLFIASLTLAEIRRGILCKPPGRKRRQLEAWFGGPEGPMSLFAGRILPFDESAALIWGRIIADGIARGRPRSAFDMIFAATAEANGCVAVTGNEKAFAGLNFINPLR